MLHYDRPNLDFACVYKIVCKKNGLIYVGQTNNFGHRMREHARHVAHYETTSVWWARVFAKSYGAKDFNEDYDVTILDYFDIDDPIKLRDALSHSERWWIERFDSTNRKYGFNTQAGGWYPCKLPENKLLRHGFKRSAYYVYDYNTGNVTLKYSMAAIGEMLGKPTSIIKSYKRTMLLLDGRWLILDMAYKHRLETAEKFYKNAIENVRDSKIEGREAQILISTMITMRAYIVAENTILVQFPTKVGDNGNVDTVSDENSGVAIKNTELWEKRLTQLELEYIRCASSYVELPDPSNSTKRQFKASITNLPIKVVDIQTNEVRSYLSITEFVAANNVSKFNFYKKLKRGTLINKRHLLYFLDTDLREYFLESVREYCRGDPEKKCDNKSLHIRLFNHTASGKATPNKAVCESEKFKHILYRR